MPHGRKELVKMKYRLLGNSGLYVSRITLGTMTFGVADWGCDEKEAHDIMRKYLDAGGNSIDCADVYAGGRAEEIIGSFVSEIKREEVILSSKCYFPVGDAPNMIGVSRKRIIASCEASLKRMKTDYFDLYYIHGPDPVTPPEESMRALDDLVRQGKVRYLGCSNIFGWQMAKAAGIAARMNLEPLIAGQYLYNLIHREPEREIIPSAVDHGLGIFCYSPLGAGVLTGKYKGMSEPAEGMRLSFRMQVDGPRFWHEKGFKTAEVLEQVSSDSGIPMWKLAIGWPLGRKSVTSVIIGVKNQEQLVSNMELGDWDVPEDVWNALEERTRPEEDYLNWFAKNLYNRFFSAAEFHSETAELP
jgi:aryl-alcohol dehydrogenase-like predicted oxidoreductase